MLTRLLIYGCLTAVLCGPLAVDTLSPRLAARSGEVCVVCDRPVAEGGPAYLYGGQRVAVCPHEEDAFLADPAAYTSRLRPDNILMSSQPRDRLSNGWLWLGVFIALGIVFGGLCARTAVGKGRPPWPWFAFGFIGSAASYLVLASLSPVTNGQAVGTRAPLACPACHRENHPAASRCAGCGAALTPQAESETGLLDKEGR